MLVFRAENVATPSDKGDPVSYAKHPNIDAHYHDCQEFWLLLEGAAEVVKRDRDGGEVSIATVEAPTVLGEMGLITDRPHSATVRAISRCEFHLLTRSQFDRLLKSENLAAYKVVATLAEVIAWRLSRMDDKVVELARRGDGSAPVEELATFKQKLFSEWNF